MEYRKTGRGGAGNYYTQQDLDKAAKEVVKGKVGSDLYLQCKISVAESP